MFKIIFIKINIIFYTLIVFYSGNVFAQGSKSPASIATLVVKNQSIQIFKDNSENCISNNDLCIFYYTPLYTFNKKTDGKIDLKINSLDSVKNVELDIIADSKSVENSVLQKINSLLKSNYSDENIKPLYVEDITADSNEIEKFNVSGKSKNIIIFTPRLSEDAPNFADDGAKFNIKIDVTKDNEAKLLKDIYNGLNVQLTVNYENFSNEKGSKSSFTIVSNINTAND